MNDSELIRKMLDTVKNGNTTSVKALTEGVHIELDGPEADEFVERLMQLSGQHELPAELPDEMPADEFATAVDLPEPTGDLVAQDTVPAEFSMDGGIDMPLQDSECMECGMPESQCSCDHEVEEAAEHDFGNAHNTAEVDHDSYMWSPQITKQRLVKGVMGDNPMTNEDSDIMERFTKVVDDYIAFLNESENEEGVASPLTSNSRNEFNKDPFASEEAKTDGSMSPMSKIKRQDVPK